MNQHVTTEQKVQTNNNSSSNTSRWAAAVMLSAALTGFADATYLTYSHFAKSDVACSLLDGCNAVLGSTYATVAGIPVALFGALFYAVLVVLTIWYFRSSDATFIRYAALLALAGLAASLYLVYLQLFVIDALCFYCIVSAILTVVLAVTGVYLLRKISKRQ